MNEYPHKDRNGRALRTPLQVLWDDNGDFGRRIKELATDDIHSLLKGGVLVQFVEVNVGEKLLWVPHSDRFRYWKSRKSNLFCDGNLRLEDYPDSFFWDASEWFGRQGEIIVVLEKNH
jgi:hypothetical protein